jgi:TPR repeat protein
MINTAKLLNTSLTKVILLISFSFLLLPQAFAEDGLYERGIELIEQKNYEKALMAFELGAKTGDLNAMTALGIMYITGIGVIQNDIKGFKYVQDAANKSHPKAQYTLGAIYYLGAGTSIDFKKAFSWISLSADQGYSDAQHNLAQMYEAGEGVLKDSKKAYEYYLKAARNDNLDSQVKVAQMYQEGIGTKKNLEKSAYWLKKIEESKVKN